MTKTALLGICLIAFSGCGNDTPEPTSGADTPDPGQTPSVSPPTPPKPMTEEVALQFDVDVVDGQATIRGSTNLSLPVKMPPGPPASGGAAPSRDVASK